MEENTQQHTNALPVGSKLQEFEILSVLGQGGFGITYKVKDTNLEKIMAIKEYMPSQFASRSNKSTVTHTPKDKDTFEWGKQRFLEEAKLVANHLDHISLVKVYRYFEANNTAYFVMDYYEGETLEDYLKRHPNKHYTQVEILSVLMPIIEGLKAVHNKGYLHRDIASDNIFLRIDKLPILIDFGASRNALGVKSQSISAIVKHGYSPPEQYASSSTQDATSDLYAMSAVIYEMIAGKRPPESTHRQTQMLNSNQDPIEDIVTKYKGKFEPSFLETIQKGLSLRQKERIQTIKEYQEGLVREGGMKQPSIPPSSNRGTNIAIILATVAIIGAIVFVNRPTPEPKPIVEPIIDNLSDKNTTNSYSKNNPVLDAYLQTKPYKECIDKVKEHYGTIENIEQSCNDNDMRACNAMGYLYAMGDGVKEDEPKAVELYKKACDGGDTNGCGNLGWMYGSGEGGLKEDKSKAVELYKKACDGGNARGCAVLGTMYDNGKGGLKEDKSKAVELYTKACDGGNTDGCANLGTMYNNGEGGLEEDKSKAVELFKKACDGGNARGCAVLGWMYEEGKGGLKEDKSKAVELYTKACDGGNADGCANLGVMYRYGKGGLKEDKSKAAELYIKACDGGNTYGCTNLGTMYNNGKGGLKEDKSKAVELYKKACDGGNAYGCAVLGMMYEKGEGGLKEDKSKAVELYRKACDGGNAHGCADLGGMYNNGEGGLKEDKSKAVELYKKACDSGDARGCNNLKNLRD